MLRYCHIDVREKWGTQKTRPMGPMLIEFGICEIPARNRAHVPDFHGGWRNSIMFSEAGSSGFVSLYSDIDRIGISELDVSTMPEDDE